jgi:hypothetical protein
MGFSGFGFDSRMLFSFFHWDKKSVPSTTL